MTVTLDSVNAALQAAADGIDVSFTLSCSALVIIMQVGFAYVEAGNVRVKNVRSILLKNVVDYVLGGLTFSFFSSALARGTTWHGLFGTDGFGGIQPDNDPDTPSLYKAKTLFMALFACTTSTIISGAIAERMRLSAYVVLSLLSPIVLYGPPAHWLWHDDGILNSSTNKYLAVSDFAGGAVVHMTGGVAAIVAAWFVGPRIGRYSLGRGTEKTIDGHSVVLSGLGTWLILFGWLGFNAGSSGNVSTTEGAYQAAIGARNTFISVITGALVSVVYHVLVLGKLNLGEMFNSMLAGAAAITAGAGYMPMYGALVTGFIGTCVYIMSVPVVARRLRIDDPLNAASVHFSAAAVGVLFVGIFHEDEGLIATGNLWKLVAQLVGSGVIIANSACWTGLILVIFTLTVGPVRVDEKTEILGCDIELDGIGAYEGSGDVGVKYEVIVANAPLYEEFKNFLKSIYCYHNIEFLEAVSNFETGLQNPSVDSKIEAQSIFDQFMCPDGSPDPVAVPDWQVTQVRQIVDKFTKSFAANLTKSQERSKTLGSQTSTSESALLLGLFNSPKQEIIGMLEQTIKTHFCHNPALQRFQRHQKKSVSKAPLHWIAKKAWCFQRAKPVKYGRARPFDPLSKFEHTEQLDSDDESEDYSDSDSDEVTRKRGMGHTHDFAHRDNEVGQEPGDYNGGKGESDSDEE